MTTQSADSKSARKLERLYATKDHGIKHSVVLRAVREKGYAATAMWLEAQGLKPQTGVTVR